MLAMCILTNVYITETTLKKTRNYIKMAVVRSFTKEVGISCSGKDTFLKNVPQTSIFNMQ